MESTIEQLDRAEFYITNVCNLNCDNCNRLNNYYFSGHQLWKNYSKVYKEWGEKLHIKNISILGGEPLLNPSILEWMSGIRKIWPTAVMQVTSNGTRIDFVDGLYQSLLENNIELAISSHNRIRHKEIAQLLTDNFLKSPISKKYDCDLSNWSINAYNKVKAESWPECKSIDEFHLLPIEIQKECTDVHKIDPENYVINTGKVYFQDKNNVKVSLSYYEDFVTAPLKYNNNGQFLVYDSDPTEAHRVCISKFCHHFIKGKLYKCHHVALLPEFMEQFNVIIKSEDQKLLASYQPLTVDSDLKTIREFIKNIKNEIPQCKLCPSKLTFHYFQSDKNKIKIQKRNK